VDRLKPRAFGLVREALKLPLDRNGVARRRGESFAMSYVIGCFACVRNAKTVIDALASASE
jgi:hypothetical protein